MSMDYSIKADKETDCDDFFPEGLSNFLEQLPLTEYYGEVRQVAKILDINLDAFEHYDHGMEEEKEMDFWQDIHAFTNLVESFIHKIADNSDYYKRVRYNNSETSLSDHLHDLFHENDQEGMIKLLEQMYGHPDMAFPPDRGYLSEGRILEDLHELQQILHCYKAAGATKIKLIYG